MAEYKVNEKLLSETAIFVKEFGKQLKQKQIMIQPLAQQLIKKTGGVFVDSIWLKDNYSSTNNIQKVIGKLFTENNISNHITGDMYNSVLSGKTTIIGIHNTILGLTNSIVLNKLPIADAKMILL